MIDCSIIIPHYNQIDYLTQCLYHLKRQEAKGTSYEIIVVDNGSDDDLHFLEEALVRIIRVQTPKSPYVCRNRGITQARGQILCFLDAKCRPDKKWLVSGYKHLLDHQYDIVGGQFSIESRNTLTARIFPLMYLDNQKNVKYRYGLPGGNLFVRKEIFQELGPFETRSESGSDIAWTRRAIEAGFRLGFAEKSKVLYPGKTYHQLLKDITKYGRGAYLTGQKSWYSAIPFLMPMKFNTFLENSRKFDWNIVEMVGAWLLVWRAKIQFAMGMISGIFQASGGRFLHKS